MKILLIDDDTKKLRKLIKVLEAGGIRSELIQSARSAQEARRELSRGQFDLVVLDLLLPRRDEGRESLEVSLELLREIHERDILGKPSRIIGFTAFADAAETALPVFRELLWTVVIYDETSNLWEQQFLNLAAYLGTKSGTGPPQGYGVDVCVVTSLQSPEQEALHRLNWRWQASTPMDDLTFVSFGTLPGRQREFTVVSACAEKMGNVASALLSARLIVNYRPRFLVMTGICAGNKPRVNLGDVVLFSPTWEWASGKVVGGVEQGSMLLPEPHQIPVSEFIVARAHELKRDSGFWNGLRERFPMQNSTIPKLVVGPGASGPSVVAHGETREGIENQNRRLTAIDMEAYGMYAAAASAPYPRPTALALKGVCDFADEEKSDDMQAYAAFISANACQALLERNLDDIVSLAGT